MSTTCPQSGSEFRAEGVRGVKFRVHGLGFRVQDTSASDETCEATQSHSGTRSGYDSSGNPRGRTPAVSDPRDS